MFFKVFSINIDLLLFIFFQINPQLTIKNMKQKLLFSVLFLTISFISNAQLTVTGSTTGPIFESNDTPAGQFYTLSTGVFSGAPGSISPLVKDPGSNLYARDGSGGGVYVQFLIIRMGNYWYLGNKNFVYPSSSYQIKLRYPVATSSIDPPCSGLWEVAGSAIISSGGVVTFTGTGIYQTVTIAGTSCSVNNPVLSPFNINTSSISLPQLSYGQIINIPSPALGMMVYNTTNNCVSLYTGSSWSCLVAASNTNYNVIALSTLPFTLTNQNNYVIYTGTPGTLTLPVASTCVGRLYNIVNYGTGVLTLSQSYTIANSVTSTTINQNTDVQIIATSTGWYKVS